MDTTFEPLYRNVLTLPDPEVRRLRLQALEQALVDDLFEKGYLRARPLVQVAFDSERASQGAPRAGARADRPGQVIMRSDPWGRVADATGCMPAAADQETLGDVLLHRWSVLFHELGHFTFDQLSAQTLVRPLEGHVPDAVVAGLREHVWAPFLSNRERLRLNETFADVWSSAVLLTWLGDRARPEIEALQEARHQARVACEEAWDMGDVPESERWVHLSDRALERLLTAPPEPQRAETFLATVVTHAVLGTLDRWRAEGEQAKDEVCRAWSDPAQLSRLQTAVLHARQNHDHGQLETWMADHPNHPWMTLAHRLRWVAPATVGKGAEWAHAWDTWGMEGMGQVLDALEQMEPQWSLQPNEAALPTLGSRPRRRP